MVRLFEEFQDALSGIASRLLRGASYVDGTAPQLLVPAAKSSRAAVTLMTSHGRSRPAQLKWSKASFINDNLGKVMHAADAFRATVSGQAVVINEMRIVRNRIAHSNPNVRQEYARVVRAHYGARRNNISPGTLLLTQRFVPCMLRRYIISCRAVVKDCSRS